METKLKSWPIDETETVAMEELLAGVEKVLRDGYTLTATGDAPAYNGYGLGKYSLVCVSDLDKTFSAEGLAYHAEQGRDLLSVVLAAAFSLGVEQGRRISEERYGWLGRMENLKEVLGKEKRGG